MQAILWAHSAQQNTKQNSLRGYTTVLLCSDPKYTRAARCMSWPAALPAFHRAQRIGTKHEPLEEDPCFASKDAGLRDARQFAYSCNRNPTSTAYHPKARRAVSFDRLSWKTFIIIQTARKIPRPKPKHRHVVWCACPTQPYSRSHLRFFYQMLV